MAGARDDNHRLGAMIEDARQRTLALVADLCDPQLLGDKRSIVNPLLWEIGHVAWFQEYWVLRHGLGRPPLRADGDALYDSTAIAHDRRWELPLPSRAGTLDYMAAVQDRVLAAVTAPDSDPHTLYLARYCMFHEDMHDEAFTYTRQTLGYPAPPWAPATATAPVGATTRGDRVIPAHPLRLGAERGASFVFDNEKWAHPVDVEKFAIAAVPVTQDEFRGFVEAGGYGRADLWCERGWSWRQRAAAAHPVYWRGSRTAGWQRREFDRWVDLEPNRPMLHVNWYEAEAYCRWAGRRLPSEAEWEAAALHGGDGKPAFPWGDEPPSPTHAHLDWRSRGCVDVDAHPAGDTRGGLRQMIGNVWEWTATTFEPYPGFEPDMYQEYSLPWFGARKVLRGGCFCTTARMIRATWRNYREPHRRDTFTGFRTCER
jgi:iron(II)-dependent oxidoreductase